MRRSFAPSMKRSLGRTEAESADDRNNKKKVYTAPPVTEEKQHLERPATTIFKVVWGKISTRKHKIWEGDGLLEVSGRSAILRDDAGKVISNASGLKLDEVQEGIQMVVGSKEVEILERLESKAEPCVTSSANVATENKTALNEPLNVDCAHRKFKPIVSRSANDACEDQPVEPLIMKKLPFERQFQRNSSNELAEVQVPTSLTKHLRPHQRDGVAFLYECVTGMRMMEPPGFGAILADEMGLGKTLQCIALMYTLLKTGPYGKPLARRVLIVTPSSLVDNWDQEITKWLRNERVFTFIVGPHKKLKLYAQSPHIPILIISYEMLAKQIDELESVKFDLIFCDEGHRLKNSDVKVFGVLSRIECLRRVIITGTPIQNDLQEFYSLINFVNPGVLGPYQDFKARYETPIVISQRPGVLLQSIELGIERLNELNAITGRFVLRRTQEVINRYLPEKHELVVFCYPSEWQTEVIRTALTLYEQSKGSPTISPLQLITILKKICNHPSLVWLTGNSGQESFQQQLIELLPSWQAMRAGDSAKLAIVESLLKDLLEKQEKIVIVSYYNKTLDMIADLCQHYNYKHCRLDGGTAGPDRSKIVTAFNSASSDTYILLLSAKAGGAGLNLIGASRLVLYDNDWNPANDLQAMSRVWRDGQRRPVFIYRLLTAFSIEERIFQRQISKTSLSGTVVDQKRNLNNLQFSDEELKDLFTFVDPRHVDGCLTHSLLECPCAGIGMAPETPETPQPLNELDCLLQEPTGGGGSPWYLVGRSGGQAKGRTKYALKMQELMRWEHHRSPVSESVLEQLGLSRCSDKVVFLFRNIVCTNK
ncbi:DNA repair and recombination protein RAD54B-like [Anopheles cruzii]|uniref:DNA repair and recombination protein RAD54B-like n=1 Tax=Anopheles cruzii TaxID=68878 RepID=UPI0022EC2E87|nr:DNA repair and recombination protein RAD54B-like [Anopheles cruzii]